MLGLGTTEGSYSLTFSKGTAEQQLGFVLAEVREARLVPVLDFKGRKPRAAADADPEFTNDSAAGPAPAAAPETTKG